eukprot:5730228-Pyramimonas_sp.AAC.1
MESAEAGQLWQLAGCSEGARGGRQGARALETSAPRQGLGSRQRGQLAQMAKTQSEAARARRAARGAGARRHQA